ncbi:hypothetical protein KF728_07970 [Candidatus Obscuribacterales bacterium]|nr:hypothetical protein [Candidatus Obscuribacterales bacterium]MBX3150066.1 hypothetical protein [Candidatus Obscuribacterales bacterium]
MTNTIESKAHPGRTARTDNWWANPLMVAVGFGVFIAYATFRTFENNYFEVDQYLSPFYSPKLAFDWWHFSPAILILWIPAGFRATCYYYRKAYYRAYFMTPPGCAVMGTSGTGYSGETKFPFILQNMHRYFFYCAALVLLVLWYDAIISFRAPDGRFTVSLLSLFMCLNCYLLSGYTFGCHAWRHLCGGAVSCFSKTEQQKAQFRIWHFVTKLNEHHQGWAWASLFSVGLTDLYIRSVAAKIIPPGVLF